MRTSEFTPPNFLVARATSGQRLDIRYDPMTNALMFVEDDWSMDVRGGAAPRSAFREQLDTLTIRRFPRRKAA
ncbi:MAG: hypothetical protein ABI398_08705 [Devosia sp.]